MCLCLYVGVRVRVRVRAYSIIFILSTRVGVNATGQFNQVTFLHSQRMDIKFSHVIFSQLNSTKTN